MTERQAYLEKKRKDSVNRHGKVMKGRGEKVRASRGDVSTACDRCRNCSEQLLYCNVVL